VFPSENDLPSGNDLAILALNRLFVPVAINQVPTKLSAYSRVSNDFTRLHPLGAKPIFQLRRISPGRVNAISRRFNETFDFQ
jgi:hypothetical protein